MAIIAGMKETIIYINANKVIVAKIVPGLDNL